MKTVIFTAKLFQKKKLNALFFPSLSQETSSKTAIRRFFGTISLEKLAPFLSGVLSLIKVKQQHRHKYPQLHQTSQS